MKKKKITQKVLAVMAGCSYDWVRVHFSPAKCKQPTLHTFSRWVEAIGAEIVVKDSDGEEFPLMNLAGFDDGDKRAVHIKSIHDIIKDYTEVDNPNGFREGDYSGLLDLLKSKQDDTGTRMCKVRSYKLSEQKANGTLPLRDNCEE